MWTRDDSVCTYQAEGGQSGEGGDAGVVTWPVDRQGVRRVGDNGRRRRANKAATRSTGQTECTVAHTPPCRLFTIRDDGWGTGGGGTSLSRLCIPPPPPPSENKAGVHPIVASKN